MATTSTSTSTTNRAERTTDPRFGQRPPNEEELAVAGAYERLRAAG